MDNNNNNNDNNTSQSPVVDALRRHFGSGISNKEIAEGIQNQIIDNKELEVRKVITIRPLGFKNAR